MSIGGKSVGSTGLFASHDNFEALDADQRTNHDLVRWTMALIERLEPPQWSLEEVDDKATKGTGLVIDSGVRGALQAVKRRKRGFIDYDVFQLERYGVPQARTRLIAGRPATIEQLRHARALRVAIWPWAALTGCLGVRSVRRYGGIYQPKEVEAVDAKPGLEEKCAPGCAAAWDIYKKCEQRIEDKVRVYAHVHARRARTPRT